MSPESIKFLRNSMIISSIIMVLLGITFIVWPAEAANMLARVLAVVILIGAVVEFILFFFAKRGGFTDVMALVSGVVLAVISIFLLIRPDLLVSFFNVVFGIIIIIMGIDHIAQSLFIIRHIRTLWWVSLFVGIGATLMGILIIVNPFSATNAAMILIGITMLIEGIAGFWNLPALKPKPGSVKNVTPVDSSDDEQNF